MEYLSQAVRDECDALLVLGTPHADIAEKLGVKVPWVAHRSMQMRNRQAKQDSKAFQRLKDLSRLSPTTSLSEALSIVNQGAR